MSSRPGTLPVNLPTISSAVLGGATGRTIAINNGSQALVDAISLLYTATATVGNRQPTIRLLDSGGNILWQCTVTTAITAGQAVRLVAGAGVTPVSSAVPLMQTMQLPSELAVPAQSQIQILDGANIDVNDTVSGNFSIAM